MKTEGNRRFRKLVGAGVAINTRGILAFFQQLKKLTTDINITPISHVKGGGMKKLHVTVLC